MRIIGDVHGKFPEYKNLLNGEPSIQLGDMGFSYDELSGVPLHNRFIKGNHDNYDLQDPHDLGDYGEWNGVFFVRGAKSIDAFMRTEGVSWWRQEELSYARLCDAVECYASLRPEIVVSHDCPQSIASLEFGISDITITREALQQMLNIHQPKLWVFGHHHRSFTTKFWGTKFVCLAELEFYDIQV